MRAASCILLVLAFSRMSAQDSTRIAAASEQSGLRLVYDNDLFSGTDRYYTQGIIIEFTAPFIEHSPTSKLLLRPAAWTKSHTLVMQQDCFTPRSIVADSLDLLDRPFAGLFLLTHRLQAADVVRKLRLTSAISIGLAGSCAMCEETQKGIHRATNNAQPRGWQRQIRNGIALNYSVSIERNIFKIGEFGLLALGGARAGSLYSDAEAGLGFELGAGDHFTNLFIPKNSFRLQISGGAKGRLVAYNAILQGLPFTRNIHTISGEALQRLVYLADIGISIAYGRLAVGYRQFFLGTEFAQGLDHRWGRCMLSCVL